MKRPIQQEKKDRGRYRYLVFLLFVFVLTGLTTASIFSKAMGITGMASASKKESYELIEVSDDKKGELEYFKNKGNFKN